MLSADCVEVDGLDFLVAEVDVEDTVLSGRSESDSPAGEGVADFECASEQRGCTLLLDFAEVVAECVFEG
ncbi:hypothetical protein, partial [Mesorhizobium loti]|uniref:hypothetical protein n=1 Tax=Rhizobium loti TaxID=381 RepID=UPI001AEC287B